MPDHYRRRRLARLLAPLALVGCTAALAGVVLSSDVIGGDEESSEQATEQRPAEARGDNETRRKRTRARYTVRTGDTLGAIAERTGVSVERIQQLNPQIDPQALVAGQKIRLRE